MDDLKRIKEERRRWLEWKNIAPLHEAVKALPNFERERIELCLEDVVRIDIKDISVKEEEAILMTAKLLKPWRKGPFQIGNLFIDSEWRSYIKYNLLQSHFDLNGKIVGDIGCNNGYYLFRMLQENPKKLVGFDPSPLYYCQFRFIDAFVQSDIVYELLGIEHLPIYEHRFDVLFCLGVLYHRKDPVGMLKSLYQGLNGGGEVFLDTFMIDGEEPVALVPGKRYAKMPNVYFIPTVSALRNWSERAGFSGFEVLALMQTETTEQRKTEWIDTQSLEDFLDPIDRSRTIEGYPAPKRLYVRLVK